MVCNKQAIWGLKAVASHQELQCLTDAKLPSHMLWNSVTASALSHCRWQKADQTAADQQYRQHLS